LPQNKIQQPWARIGIQITVCGVQLIKYYAILYCSRKYPLPQRVFVIEPLNPAQILLESSVLVHTPQKVWLLRNLFPTVRISKFIPLLGWVNGNLLGPHFKEPST